MNHWGFGSEVIFFRFFLTFNLKRYEWNLSLKLSFFILPQSKLFSTLAIITFPSATISTSSCSCSCVPLLTPRILCCFWARLCRQNEISYLEFPPTTRTPSCPSTFIDLLMVLGELEKSMIISRSPWQIFLVLSIRYSS